MLQMPGSDRSVARWGNNLRTVRPARGLHCIAFFALLSPVALQAQTGTPPNILWITSEDTGPHLGAYGDQYARTPNLDALAAKGIIYLSAWSNAPVCAPARTAIISGLYPTSTGSEHMRSMTRLPTYMKMYPQLLRESGYYCTNNRKEDYNLEKPENLWDESSNRAHWKNRRAGQPFFAVFNIEASHESQIRRRPHKLVHDPSGVRIPAYHPDTPEVRNDWAQYYDNITEMDTIAGGHLKELEAAGLSDDTVVFYYGDHGSGMPRSKRWPYNSGLQVPLIVFVPEKFKDLAPKEHSAGGRTDRLVSFVDLAPTVLSLAGIRPPEYLQGHAFLGKHEASPQPYVYGFRGRMDERYDMVRSVRDKRYVYIRNYMPHRIYGQYLDYMFQTPTTRVWQALYLAGRLRPPMTYFWESKPPEELYDLREDPDEVNNLAGSDPHLEILKRMRQAQRSLAVRIRDVGFLPEGEIHSRSAGSSPYEAGHDDSRYPLDRIFGTAELASNLSSQATSRLTELLKDPDSAVRYWAAQGLLIRMGEGEMVDGAKLRTALADPSPYVRIISAEALGRFGTDEDVRASLEALLELAPLERNGIYVSIAALNSLDALGAKAAPARDRLQALPTGAPGVDSRMDSYVPRLLEKIVAGLK